MAVPHPFVGIAFLYIAYAVSDRAVGLCEFRFSQEPVFKVDPRGPCVIYLLYTSMDIDLLGEFAPVVLRHSGMFCGKITEYLWYYFQTEARNWLKLSYHILWQRYYLPSSPCRDN